MPKYTPDSRDRVYEAVDMLALVGGKLELRRAGVDSYFGLCPFHDERSGSFHVRPDERHYHCFGCGASGDPFSFVMETEGLDFKGAMESLADRFGVALQTVDEDPGAARRRERRDRLHELLDRTAAYYARYLWESPEARPARDYLKSRGLEEQALRAFRVGYAPNAWDKILVGSQRAGFTVDELVTVGLVRRSDRTRAGAYDFFREQIMFPAADARGRVHGFGARRMREDQKVAKYVNTPDGALYHKREVLFGIDRARAAAAKAGRMILVEGYTDVLALHQSGIENAVGIMGTSLTEEQVDELQRVVTVLELCLDADAAGQSAMVRGARLADGRGLELRVVELPEGSDPADLVLSAGPDRLRELVGASVPFVQFNVERILSQVDLGSAESRDAALTEIAPVFGLLAPGILRDQLIQRVSGMLELTEARLLAVLRNPPPPPASAQSSANGAPGARAATSRTGHNGHAGPAGSGSPAGRSAGRGAEDPGRFVDPDDPGPLDAPAMASAPVAPGSRSERLFLALCIALPDAGAAALEPPESELLLAPESLRRIARHLRGRTRSPMSDLPPDDEAFARQMASLVELAGRVPDPSPDRLEHNRLLLDLERLERAIRRARVEGEGTSELARERELVRDAFKDVVSRLEQTI
jgi:DNA primase